MDLVKQYAQMLYDRSHQVPEVDTMELLDSLGKHLKEQGQENLLDDIIEKVKRMEAKDAS